MTAAAAVKPNELSGFVKSALLHACLFAGIAGWEWWSNRARDTFGDPNSLGASAGVTAVATIPIPRREARPNPVANDVQSDLPTPVEKKAQPKPEPEDPEAIPLQRRQKKSQQEVIASNQKYRPDPISNNQVPSTIGQAAASNMFGVTGSGGVGASNSSPFGTRFGWYEKLLRERIAQKWRTDDVPANVRTAPMVIVAFSIARDGNVSGVRVLQSSGIYALDNSAQRAIYEAAPMPRLPDQFERPAAQVEFHFELRR
jgi:protein TonB